MLNKTREHPPSFSMRSEPTVSVTEQLKGLWSIFHCLEPACLLSAVLLLFSSYSLPGVVHTPQRSFISEIPILANPFLLGLNTTFRVPTSA